MKIKRTLVSTAFAGAVALGLGSEAKAVQKFWREDFTTGITQSYEANPSDNWYVDSGYLKAKDFDFGGFGRMNFLFKDKTYPASNYICSTLVDRDVWNSGWDSPGIIFNAKSLDDFYYFSISAQEGNIHQWWVGHHVPGTNINLGNGISDLISTTTPNKLTVEVTPTETQFYINDNFLTTTGAIEKGYKGYLGVTVWDGTFGNCPQSITSFDYFEVIPEPSTIALFVAGGLVGLLARRKMEK